MRSLSLYSFSLLVSIFGTLLFNVDGSSGRVWWKSARLGNSLVSMRNNDDGIDHMGNDVASQGAKFGSALSVSSSAASLQHRDEDAILKKYLFIVVIDAGSSKTSGELWLAPIITINNTQTVDYMRMTLKANLGRGRNLRSAYLLDAHGESLQYSSSNCFLIHQLGSLFQPILQTTLEEMASFMLHMDPDLISDSVPILLHATAGLRDMPVTRQDALLEVVRNVLNRKIPQHCRDPMFDFQVPNIPKKIRFFTTRKLCRLIRGQEEGIFTFLTANLASNKFSMTPPDSPMDRFDGILEVGGASMQLVVPFRDVTNEQKLEATDLIERRYILMGNDSSIQAPHAASGSYPDLKVFGISYMNLGATRALALLMKRHCQQTHNLDRFGRCEFPCFQSGWLQQCIPGEPKLRRGGTNFAVDQNGTIEIAGNDLTEVAEFCSLGHPLVKYFPMQQSECIRAGFDVYEDNLVKRASISNCTAIVGTGDFDLCQKYIMKDLLVDHLPTNLDALRVTDNAAPAEVGKSLLPQGDLHIVGGSMFWMVKDLKRWQLLDHSWDAPPNLTNQQPKNNRRATSLSAFLHAARTVCSSPLDHHHSFRHSKDFRRVFLVRDTFRNCFKATYLATLFDIFHIRPEQVHVHFREKIQHHTTGQHLNLGWTYGALVSALSDQRILDSIFGKAPLVE